MYQSIQHFLPASAHDKVFFVARSLSDTVRAFKERNKLGRFSEQARVESSNSLELVNNDSQHQSGLDHELLQRFPIGARCEVTSLNNNCVSRGTIRFAGPVEFNQKSPFWIGVELDEPVSDIAGPFGQLHSLG